MTNTRAGTRPSEIMLIEFAEDGSTRVRLWYASREIVSAVAESLGDDPDADSTQTAEEASRLSRRAAMNPMTQKPGEDVEVIVLKDGWRDNGYTIAQRGDTWDSNFWYVTGSDVYRSWEHADMAKNAAGWWPLDFHSVIDE